MMREPVTMDSALKKTRSTIDRLGAASLRAPKKGIRVKRRNPGEALALCRAVVFAVREAKQAGRLVKVSPKGYLVRWDE